MSLLRKSCPACNEPFAVRRLFLWQPRTFVCSECGVRLSSGHWAVHMAGYLTGSLFYFIPILLGGQDYRWWYALPLGMVLAQGWNYLFLVPRRLKAATSPAAEDRG